MAGEHKRVPEPRLADVSSALPVFDLPARVAGDDVADLERSLLRHGVGVLTADRSHCSDCGRTPLVGERIYSYDRGDVACELCRVLRRQEPASSERVLHSEHGHAVRIRRAA